MNPRLRDIAYQRQEGWCWWCGRHLGEAYALHHRKLRSQGGTDALANLLALHHYCHNLGTHSVHLDPGAGYERGFLVRSWDDPAAVPIAATGWEVTLTDASVTRRRTGNGW